MIGIIAQAHAAKFRITQALGDLNEVIAEFEAALSRSSVRTGSVCVPGSSTELHWTGVKLITRTVVDNWSPLTDAPLRVRMSSIAVWPELWERVTQ